MVALGQGRLRALFHPGELDFAFCSLTFDAGALLLTRVLCSYGPKDKNLPESFIAAFDSQLVPDFYMKARRHNVKSQAKPCQRTLAQYMSADGLIGPAATCLVPLGLSQPDMEQRFLIFIPYLSPRSSGVSSGLSWALSSITSVLLPRQTRYGDSIRFFFEILARQEKLHGSSSYYPSHGDKVF
jgi:hypothetical protein